RSVMDGLRIGEDHDHLLGALRESAFYGLRYMDFMGPLLRANGISMKCIDNRIPPRSLLRIAGREKDKHFPIDRVPLQAPLQRRCVNLDSLHRYGLSTGNHGRNFGLYLRLKRKCKSYASEQPPVYEVVSLSPWSFAVKRVDS